MTVTGLVEVLPHPQSLAGPVVDAEIHHVFPDADDINAREKNRGEENPQEEFSICSHRLKRTSIFLLLYCDLALTKAEAP
jgi:hypothetical protein